MVWNEHWWPVFHRPVIFAILKTIWSMNINLWIMSHCDATFDLKINVSHSDPYFMVQWFCLIYLRLFGRWASYFHIMRQCDPTFDLRINIAQHDLYFMFQWFHLVSWRLFDGWTSNFWILCQCDTTFGLKINVDHNDLYFHVPVILPYILKTIWGMSIIIPYNERIWPNLWRKKYRSAWPTGTFHGPVMSPYILKTIRWMNVILQDNESMWCKFWVHNKWRLHWPIFQGLVILPYILKTIWCKNVILSDNEWVWPNLLPQI